MTKADILAQSHWNETPLFSSEEGRYAKYPWLYEAAEFTGHAGERVLEIGCGSGCDLLQFAKHGSIATGVDLTKAHVELARERCASYEVDIRQADACTLPFENEGFDYIYSHGVIHHSDEPRRISKEMRRVLKKGGRFNVHLYNRWSWVPLYLFYKHGFQWRNWIENSRDPVYVRLYTPRTARKLFWWAQDITVQKFESYPTLPQFGPYVGWFLVVKGVNCCDLTDKDQEC